ncbi:MAG: hypothetical protein R3E99_08000 [Burkholderiaceae bacterium]
MRQAPPVAFPLRRCAPLAVALAMAGLLPLVQAVLWWQSQAAGQAHHPLLALQVLLSLLWMAWAWRVWSRWPSGVLQWRPEAADSERSGTHSFWLWTDAGHGQALSLTGVEVCLDLQTHALLRMRLPGGATVWASASRSTDPAQWIDLRRAWVAAA